MVDYRGMSIDAAIQGSLFANDFLRIVSQPVV